MPTKIEWTDDTWNPITGCTKISAGCRGCYAERMAKRLAGRAGYDKDDPFRVTFHPNRYLQPFRWRKPRRVFVCSMGDLFHVDVPFNFIANIWDTMFDLPQHTFQVLTKRSLRMLDFAEYMKKRRLRRIDRPNVWIGTTVEDQSQDHRIGDLLMTPAATRFVSCEPLLGPIDLCQPGAIQYPPGHTEHLLHGTPKPALYSLDWVIVGAETGPGARYMDPDWARDIRDQCRAAGVPFFMKQMSGKAPIPDDLMIREYPEVKQ